MSVTRTRIESAARAQQLRDEGLKLREIAEQMGVAISTVHAWLTDPDGSQLKARKNSYRGRCEQCGGPTDGSNGAARAPKVCAECLRWTGEEIIAAIRAWADEHGGMPPTAQDWQATDDGNHPCSRVVCDRIGWNQALLQAGFGLRCDRRPETQAWIEEQLRAGVPTGEIADRLGVTPEAIHNRMQYRGTTVARMRSAA